MASLSPIPPREKSTRPDKSAPTCRGVRRWVSDWLARGALREEFEDLEHSGCLDDVLIDLGISRWEVERVIRGYPEAGRLMPAMAKRLGLDVEGLEPRMRYMVGQHCAVCQSHRRCRQWLATASAESTAYRDFCPNAALFDTILARLHGAEAASVPNAEADGPAAQ